MTDFRRIRPIKQMLTAQQIIDLLRLIPHESEGGYFRETYRAATVIPATALPDGYSADRNASTAIYYLLTPETFSAIHRVRSDEVFHFYAGDAVEMLQLSPDGTARTIFVGNDLAAGHEPQVVVPAGVWQGCRLIPGGRWALMGCTVAPGFDFADFELGKRDALLARYSTHSELIAALTPNS
ncbi:MAG TPA: cupin domain-containing protein [Lacipirellulaceae bacterium]|nr:cupin domain-containing protein [Lacipirellulaceae bacterium]